jgi:hypothetical protein
MRLLVNFQDTNGWTVHCLAEDCQTRISPALDVASLETLRRLLRRAGTDEDEMQHFEQCVRTWGKGSVWIDNLTREGANLLGIQVQQPVEEQIR